MYMYICRYLVISKKPLEVSKPRANASIMSKGLKVLYICNLKTYKYLNLNT